MYIKSRVSSYQKGVKVLAEEKEVKVKEPEVLITENYGIGFDNYNIILMEKYQKKDGKGKHSNFIDEWGWRDLGYFGSVEAIARYLVKYELMQTGELDDLYRLIDRIEVLTDDISAMLKRMVSKID